MTKPDSDVLIFTNKHYRADGERGQSNLGNRRDVVSNEHWGPLLGTACGTIVSWCKRFDYD